MVSVKTIWVRRYAVCFRQRAGLCGLQLTAEPGQFILNSRLAAQEEAVGPDCHNFTINSNNDYIQVTVWCLQSCNTFYNSGAHLQFTFLILPYVMSAKDATIFL